MKDVDREALREELVDRLLQIYRKVRADISISVLGVFVEEGPQDEADESAVDELRDLDAQMTERDRELAHLIEEALARMRTGAYGICVDCGREIPLDRLRLVPWAERCAEDQERAERGETHPTM